MKIEQPEPLDEVFAALRQMPVPERPADADLLTQLKDEPLLSTEPKFSPRARTFVRPAIWSAAIAVVVVVVSLLQFSGSVSVALADVIAAAEKHKLVKYTMTQSDELKKGSVVMPLVQTVYADLKAPRFRYESRHAGRLNGAVDSESIFITDGTKNVKLHLLTEVVTTNGKTDPKLIEDLKRFPNIPRAEATISTLYDDFTPATAASNKSMLDNIRELEIHKDAIGTKGKLNGKDVLKYRIEEEYKTISLAVDAVTRLPARLEQEITDPKVLHPTASKMTFLLSDFEWDPDLKDKRVDDLFETTPPKGFTVDDLRK